MWNDDIGLCICDDCGTPFRRRKSVAAKSHKHFCSRECRARHQSKTFTCPNCGSSVVRRLNLAGKRGFCSRGCYIAYNARKQTRMCSYCGEAVERFPSRFRDRVDIFCGIKCRHLWLKSRAKEKHPMWKENHRRVTDYGYVMIRSTGHPRADHTGMVYEHVVVMERKLGHPIPDGMNVHHINGIRDDNRPENLDIVDWKNHRKMGQTRYTVQQQRIRELEAILKVYHPAPIQ